MKTTNSKVVNTPYDDVFRTLLNDCSRLIIPVINEAFNECFSGDEKVVIFTGNPFFESAGRGGSETDH